MCFPPFSLNMWCCLIFPSEKTVHKELKIIPCLFIMKTNEILKEQVRILFCFLNESNVQYVLMYSTFIHRLEWTARLLAESGVPHSFHFLLSHLFMWRASVLWLRGAITQHCHSCSADWLSGDSHSVFKLSIIIVLWVIFCRPNAAIRRLDVVLWV